MASPAHLAKRFAGSLVPGGPARRDVAWVQRVLAPAEAELWSRMSGPDRRHSVAVARMVHTERPDAPTEVMAAALLHDVGKIHCRLRTFGRVVATLTIRLAGTDEVESWRHLSGLHRKIALYLLHPAIGGDDLALAGSHELTVGWAREHHRPRELWMTPREWADLLDRCDND